MEAKPLDCGEKKKDLAEQAKGQESSSNSVGNGEAMKMDKAIPNVVPSPLDACHPYASIQCLH
jgi:hypothetical protein